MPTTVTTPDLAGKQLRSTSNFNILCRMVLIFFPTFWFGNLTKEQFTILLNYNRTPRPWRRNVLACNDAQNLRSPTSELYSRSFFCCWHTLTSKLTSFNIVFLLLLSLCWILATPGRSAGARRNEPLPPASNYNNWPSIFWRPFSVATLLNNDRLLILTVQEVHLYRPFTQPFLVWTYLYANVYGPSLPIRALTPR